MKSKKLRKFTSLILAASIMASIPTTQTNCGFLDFTSRNENIFGMIGFYSLALGCTIGHFAKNSHHKTNSIFYLKNFGGLLVGLAGIKKAVQNLQAFSKSKNEDENKLKNNNENKENKSDNKNENKDKNKYAWLIMKPLNFLIALSLFQTGLEKIAKIGSTFLNLLVGPQKS